MQKKLVAVVLIALIGGLASTFDIKVANASGTIYIKAYGGVVPSQAPIQIDGNVYTFKDNIFDSIVVERNNIVIDGAGYALLGKGDENGITLSNRTNVTIKNMEIRKFYKGIYLEYSSNNSIYGNNIANNGNGIWLFESSNNNISGNSIKGNGFHGIYLNDFSNYNNIFRNNITNNVASIHFYRSSRNIITGNNIAHGRTHALGLWYSNYNRIYSNNITANRDGIILSSCSYNILKGNSLTDNNFRVEGWNLRHFVNDVDVSNMIDGKPIHYWVGKRDMSVPLDAGMVVLVNCTRITVKNLKLTNNEKSTLLAYTTHSTITRNDITNNNYGIYLSDSSNNSISENNIINNRHGIWFAKSSNNRVAGNNITNNDNGIRLLESSNNTIYHNNVVDNTEQVYSQDSTNVWDDGYPSGGNYWSDYKGVDANGDGIGDTPYVIDANNQDNYPLCTRAPFWMQWWFWTIVIAVIATLAAVYFLKKRKLPTARRRLEKRRLIRLKDSELA